MGAQVNGISTQTVSAGVGSNTVKYNRGTQAQVIQKVLGKRKYDFEEPDAKKPKMINWHAKMQAHIDQLQAENKKQMEEMETEYKKRIEEQQAKHMWEQAMYKKVMDEVMGIIQQMEGDTSTTNDDLSMEGDSSTTTDDLTMEERSGKRKRDSSEDEPAAKKLRYQDRCGLADTTPHLPWYLIREARLPFRVHYRLYSEIGKGNPPLPWQYITERNHPYRTRLRLYSEFGDSFITEIKERKLKLYSEYDSPVQCEECEETFDSVKAYEAHNCKPSVYGCGICGKNLLTRSAHDQHKRTMHNKISPKLVKR